MLRPWPALRPPAGQHRARARCARLDARSGWLLPPSLRKATPPGVGCTCPAQNTGRDRDASCSDHDSSLPVGTPDEPLRTSGLPARAAAARYGPRTPISTLANGLGVSPNGDGMLAPCTSTGLPPPRAARAARGEIGALTRLRCAALQGIGERDDGRHHGNRSPPRRHSRRGPRRACATPAGRALAGGAVASTSIVGSARRGQSAVNPLTGDGGGRPCCGRHGRRGAPPTPAGRRA